MATKVPVKIVNFGHDFLVLALLKCNDYGQDLQQAFSIRKRKPLGKIDDSRFIGNARAHLDTIRNIYGYDKNVIERVYNVKFCQVVFRKGEKLGFIDEAIWGRNVIYYTKQDKLYSYIRLPPQYIFQQLSVKRVLQTKPEMTLLKFSSVDELLNFYELSPSSSIFNLTQIPQFRSKFQADVHIFQKNDDYIYPIYKPAASKFPEKPSLKIFIKLPDLGPNEEIRNFYLITNPNFITKIYICKLVKNCKFSTRKPQNLRDHQAICEKINVQTICGEIKAYGKAGYIMDEICDSGYLPPEAKKFRKNFFCTFDIETFEKLDNIYTTFKTEIQAHHHVLSIAVGTNRTFENCWVRTDDSHGAVVKLVNQFILYLEKIYLIYQHEMPTYFSEAIELLEQDINDKLIAKSKRMRLNSMKFFLEQFIKLDVFGFNSGW